MLKRLFKKINKLIEINYLKKDDYFRKKEFDRLANDFLNLKSLKLHFGSGPRILKNWINIDLTFEPYEKYLKYYTDKFYPENIRGDRKDFYAIDILKTGLPFPDNSIEVIFHEDFIEHLDQKEQIIFLAETFRVLKKNSIHRINTPNLLASMLKHSDFNKGKIGVYTDEWDKHVHKNLLTPNYLTEISKIIGYKEIIFNSRDKSLSEEIPPEYRPSNDRSEKENIFADLIK